MNNFLNQPVQINEASDKPSVSLGGQYSSVCVEVSGTISAGNLKIQGFIREGGEVATLFTEDVDGGAQVNGENTITSAGLYRVAPAALQVVQVTPSGDFSGNVWVTFSGSESLPPVAVIGING